MIRVAYLCEYPSINGGENSLLSFLLTPESGVEPVFLSPSSGSLSERLLACGFEQHEFSVFDNQGHRKSADVVSSELSILIGQLNIDIVHANSLSMSRVLSRVADTLDFPAVGHIRDILKVSDKVISDLSRLDLCLAVSDATRDSYIAQGLPAVKSVTVYNGIDSVAFKRTSFAPQQNHGEDAVKQGLRQRLGISVTSIVVGAAGQLGLRKGWEVLLDAVEMVLADQEQSLDLHVVLAGLRHSEKQESIEYEERLRARSQCGLLQGRLHMVGYWSPMFQFMEGIDLLAHSAHQEPLGRVLLEAAASSVPVVATDVGGTREIFGDSGAILVPPGDAKAMAEAILETIVDQRSANERVINARELIDTRFHVVSHRQQILQYYRALLEKNSTS
ncbi:MAG: hypothetical protein CMJ76_02115 [Planctomycetaceae bacterium]|nr:hypothetical protein [Planctomycetaceae bacterium]|tara:strand:+ start:444 stop:1613 length:1170 start_codon:yes stop_codon:yes gene_type:complete